MKELNSIIEEQAHWLQKKGYDEKGLNNGEAEGAYKAHLKDALQGIIDNDLILFDKEPFKVHSFGLFEQGRDKILFTFQYDFDSFERKISLREVEAILDQVPISLQIETMDDLWHSKDLYKRIKELSVPIVRAVEERRQENIQKIVSQTNNHLKNLEYEKYSTKSSDWIARRLTTVLNKAEQKPASIYYFNLHTNMQNGPTSIKASIHFEYITKLQHLSLRSVQAKLGEYKEVFSQTSNESIPKAGNLIDAMQLKQNIDRANKISQGPQENISKRQRQKQ